MDYLFDNPLANLPAVYFLILYGAAIAFSVAAFQIVKKQFDTTAQMPLPPVPTNPDVYEIAYLRGGENELARSVIFALTQKGFLQVHADEKSKVVWVQQTDVKPEHGSLQYIEQKVYEFFHTRKQSKAVFVSQDLKEVLKTFAVTYKQRLENSNLLTGAEMQSRVNRLKWFILFGVLALGGYRLLSSVVNGWFNIGFLLVFISTALIIFALLKGLPRISALGRAYLERLELAFSSLRWQISQPKPQQQLAATNGATFNSVAPTLLAVGLFGVGALAGTAYDSYHQAFYKAQQRQDAGSSGCGSGCGSSWDSGSGGSSSSCSSGGSSCGGGCGGGGCGGGGCGG